MTSQQMLQSVNNVASEIFNSVIVLLPRIFWAAVLLGAGFVLAWIFKKITVKIVRGFDKLFGKIAEERGLQHIQVKQPLERFIGETIFRLSLVFFFYISPLNSLDT